MPLDLADDEKVIIPPREAVTAIYKWLTSLSIGAPTALGEAWLQMQYVPWAGAGNEITARGPNLEDLTKTIRIDALYAAMEEVPELKIAFGAILAAVGPTETWYKKKLEDAAKAAEEGVQQ